jgi:hypothetical protein
MAEDLENEREFEQLLGAERAASDKKIAGRRIPPERKYTTRPVMFEHSTHIAVQVLRC